jgi:hypothetical protein
VGIGDADVSADCVADPEAEDDRLGKLLAVATPDDDREADDVRDKEPLALAEAETVTLELDDFVAVELPVDVHVWETVALSVDHALVDAVKLGTVDVETVGEDVRVVDIDRVSVGLTELRAEELAATEVLASAEGDPLLLGDWLVLIEILELPVPVVVRVVVRVLVVVNVGDHVRISVAVDVRVSAAEIEGLALADRVALLVIVPLREGVVVCVGVLAAVEERDCVVERVDVPDTLIERVPEIEREPELLPVVDRDAVSVRLAVPLLLCIGDTEADRVDDTVPLPLREP